ncbi:MAG: hypothetical protein J07HN4v3_00526 [Halonotius sp. J07HN4]|nr:MAG: hypothetical protein J07HN4v3_00526 [Halonotius sp. J07HN4]
MIDAIFDFIFWVLVDLIPDRVLKIVVFMIGIVTTGVGVQLLSESLWAGGALTVIGLFLVGGSVRLLLR